MQICVFLFLLICPFFAVGQVVINEVVASNSRGLADLNGENHDWIELKNTGATAVNLKGFGISDEKGKRKWHFTADTLLQPGAYFVIWASGKNEYRSNGEWHTNFRISAGGDFLQLTNAAAQPIDEIDLPEIPTGWSYGRGEPENSELWYFFEQPTPGSINRTARTTEVLQQPQLSHSSGAYEEPFDLGILCPDSNATAFYTLDGSEPTANALKYQNPIRIGKTAATAATTIADIPSGYGFQEPQKPILKATAVRAICLLPDGSKSLRQNAATYWVDLPEDFADFPHLALVTDSLGLFDHDSGIFVPGKHQEGEDNWTGNYYQRGFEWERLSHLSFLNANFEPILSQWAGFRVHGAYSRMLPRKSLRFYARRIYDDANRFVYPFFPHASRNDFNRLMLRNSGNDWGGNAFYGADIRGGTLFRDAFMQDLLKGLPFETQATQAYHLWINGIFWGILNLRERHDHHYITSKFGLPESAIEMVNQTFELEASSGDTLAYWALLDFCDTADLNQPAHFDHLNQTLAIEDYLAYFAAQIYINNDDFPFNNVRVWRNREAIPTKGAPLHPKDGRFRPMLFDTDIAFGLYRGYEYDMLENMDKEHRTQPQYLRFNSVFRSMMQSDSLRHFFANRLADYLNTLFLPEKVLKRLAFFEQQFEKSMPQHIDRWQQPESMEEWYSNIATMKEFALQRPTYLFRYTAAYFDAPSRHSAKIDVSDATQGYVELNKHLDLGGYGFPWEGTYFQGLSIHLKAIPHENYRFKHWLVHSEEGAKKVKGEELVFHLAENTQFTAIFEPLHEPLPTDKVLPNCFPLKRQERLTFNSWSADKEQGEHPPYMRFVQSPSILQADDLTFNLDAWSLDYQAGERSRIIGFEQEGVVFVNGERRRNEENSGHAAGLLLGVNTKEVEAAVLSFELAQYQVSHVPEQMSLQYKIGPFGRWRTLEDSLGEAVVFRGHFPAPQRQSFSLPLPQKLLNHEMVYFWWRLERERHQEGQGNGILLQNLKLKLVDSISGGLSEETPDEPSLKLYPNPNNGTFKLQFDNFDFTPEKTFDVNIYNAVGQLVWTQKDLNYQHYSSTTFQLPPKENGMFIVEVFLENRRFVKKMTVLSY